ncbi:anhydro-N-acetylmuramic acid kinase [Candidatus Berkiella cookevillensis]|uniref:Anhydro-N-acetylmuramic acid kinase n=1 Tax=Candidatus Berkiella cookevillensis TaxID=437022 RepID=A0A0Q9YQS3_9GAMM|nr:anhydro-N-acetylmuramic acid kinase [Candidatus Berkiella cookevillensis]MCS5709436.1 anhydro-N-acetylmuramic acid kinase [Candidatus Berkiella cookevillensis]
MYSIGLMSGTSMDGIDAALIETDGTPMMLQSIAHFSLSYDASFALLLKATEYAIKQAKGNLRNANASYHESLSQYLQNTLCLTGTKLTQTIIQLYDYLKIAYKTTPIQIEDVVKHSTHQHALAVNALLEKTGLSATQIRVIGYHGQAMFHQPHEKISIILGNGQSLANQLTIPVINDFRSQDIATGGQGAPFAPIYHQALAIRDKKIPLAVVNCGGIANITLINGEQNSDLIGFDTGPGNGLVDSLIRQRTAGTAFMDKDGHYGKKGVVHPEVLQALYAKSIFKNNQNYFSLPPPKSLDYGDLRLIPEVQALSLEDAARTLEAFTADSIIKSVLALNIPPPRHWVLAGGGWQNPVILEEMTTRLKSYLDKKITINTADEVGWSSTAMEAELFAYLAVRSLHKLPISFPNTTGVRAPSCGGTYFPPQQ